MPYSIRKLRDQNKYKVVNDETGKVKSKGTTKTKAEAQVRLLTGIEEGLKINKKAKKSKK